MTRIRSNEDLIAVIDAGNRVKYIFFWGHQENQNHVTKACLSQWYYAPYEVSGQTYLTAEHYMMARKAELFSDTEILQKIYHAKSPGEAKALGRDVRNFNQDAWNERRQDIVIEANYHKFDKNKDLKNFLLSTGERILVEASPTDKIWGIGLTEMDRDSENPQLWKGLSLLGYALMEVRDRLR